jgi:site-specific recombinase XerD
MIKPKQNVICMDEERFRDFLQKKKKAQKTAKAYVSYVKKLETYLLNYKGGKRLEEASIGDIKDFVLWFRTGMAKSSVNPYLSGFQKYYEYIRKDILRDTIKEMKRDRRSKSDNLITWEHFEESMDKADRIHISKRDRCLLNLLWSRMDSDTILQLAISDIDFERRRIISRIANTSTERVFYVTKRAWHALEEHVSVEVRGTAKPLFSINERRLQQIVKRYFADRGQTPIKLRLSCEQDIVQAGEKERFVTNEFERISLPISKNSLKWIDDQIENKVFRDRSDFIEKALKLMQKGDNP